MEDVIICELLLYKVLSESSRNIIVVTALVKEGEGKVISCFGVHLKGPPYFVVGMFEFTGIDLRWINS
jgi:hypothetical protein